MKETVKTSRTAGYMEKIFRALNNRYFEGAIEEPIITIQSTPRAYGHVTVAKAWARADGGSRHELNVGAGTLNRPIEDVVATVLHEMVHLYHLQNGTQDCSRGEQNGGRKPSSTRKLVCPHCGQSVRATRAVNILCGDCFQKMVEV